MSAYPKTSCHFLLILLIACLLPNQQALSQDVTNKQKNDVRQLAKSLDKAGRLYKSKKLDLCAKEIVDIQARMEALSNGGGKELLELIKPEYDRLAQAHKLLKDAKQELPELKPLPVAMEPGTKMVSFKTDVAPIIVEKCGRCHVRGMRGQFSAANYNSLMNSTHVAVGIPNDSRIIEVIVDGDMPPNGSVEKEKLETLKAWIQQGAKFDGDNPNQNLAQLGGAAQPPQRPRNMTVAKPTGNESVSFGLHVAPILIQNCSGCHVTMNNPRGGLNMSTFRQLLAGGDGGPIFVPGKSSESPIVKRLQAGEMPPRGKLDDKLISTIATWIDEGAKFDIADGRTAIAQVAAKARADSQTHDELLADRLNLAEKNWKLVMSNIEPTIVRTDNFIMLGSTDEETLEKAGKLAESLATKIKSTLKANRKLPLVKGNSALFVFERRYDFSEFGKMLENRSLPKNIRSYWGYTTIDAYGAVLMTRNQSPDEIAIPLTRQITAVYAASMASDVPRWFADGLGYWAAAKIHSKEDEVDTWETKANEIMSNMRRTDDFMTGRLPDHQAALVSYVFVKQLRSDSGRFNRLLGLLRSGQSFEDAFLKTYGKKPSEIYRGGGR